MPQPPRPLLKEISAKQYNSAKNHIFMCLLEDRSYEFRENDSKELLIGIERYQRVTYYKLTPYI
jgi:hypothetical protein